MEIVNLSRDEIMKNGTVKTRCTQRHPNQTPQREWSHPLCSLPQVGRLVGLEPVAGEDQTGFSPADWKSLNFNDCCKLGSVELSKTNLP